MGRTLCFMTWALHVQRSDKLKVEELKLLKVVQGDGGGFRQQKYGRSRPSRPEPRMPIAWFVTTNHCMNKQQSHVTLCYSTPTLMGREGLSVLWLGHCMSSRFPQFCHHGHADCIETFKSSFSNIFESHLLQRRAITSWRAICNVAERVDSSKPASWSVMSLNFNENLCHRIYSCILWRAFHKAEFRAFIVNVQKWHSLFHIAVHCATNKNLKLHAFDTLFAWGLHDASSPSGCGSGTGGCLGQEVGSQKIQAKKWALPPASREITATVHLKVLTHFTIEIKLCHTWQPLISHRHSLCNKQESQAACIWHFFCMGTSRRIQPFSPVFLFMDAKRSFVIDAAISEWSL